MLRFLCDENLDHRILRGLKLRRPDVECMIAQQTEMAGSGDAQLLAWAAEQARVVLTHDLKTIPKHAYTRIVAGQEMPGVIAIPKELAIGSVIDDLVTIMDHFGVEDLENAVLYLPLANDESTRAGGSR